MKILNSKEKTEIERKLNKQFGVDNIPGTILMSGKNKLFLFTGELNKNQLFEIEKNVKIERLGSYFAKIDESSNDLRLSIEGSQILKNQINKNIFSLNENQTEEWMKGRELLINTGKRGFLIMENQNDFLGTGKASEEKISNFIPKNRRLKESMQ